MPLVFSKILLCVIAYLGVYMQSPVLERMLLLVQDRFPETLRGFLPPLICLLQHVYPDVVLQL